MSIVTSTVAKGYFNTGDTPTESNFVNLIDSIPLFGVKVYAALLTQSGTSAPTVTALSNTLGGTVVWTRVGVDFYRGTLAGAFPVNKTLVLPSIGSNISIPDGTFNLYPALNTNYIELSVGGNEANGLLGDVSVPILVIVFP